jgi:hypothetical protein
MEEIKCCCHGFQNLLSCVGDRGHAVVVSVGSNGEVRFHLQSRGVSLEDQSKLRPADVDVKINLSAEIGMRYCPFCGQLLEELVHKNREFFFDLARQHLKYLAPVTGT